MGRRTGRTKAKNKGQNSVLGKALIRKAKKDRRSKFSSDAAKTGFQVADMSSNAALTSVTEINSLEEFMANAVAEDREFTAIRQNVIVLDGSGSAVLPEQVQSNNEITQLRIPRRPAWDENTTREELHRKEEKSFLAWRRELANLRQSSSKLAVTPFEKNIGVWRQLWRVVERSDVVIQIVDSRNPLLFWCPDLFEYVRQVNPEKATLLIINKADYLPAELREAWGKYFESLSCDFLFFSAKQAQEQLDEEYEALYGGGVSLLEQHLAKGEKVTDAVDPRHADLFGPIDEAVEAKGSDDDDDSSAEAVDTAAAPAAIAAEPPLLPEGDVGSDAASVGSGPASLGSRSVGGGGSVTSGVRDPYGIINRQDLLELLQTKYNYLREKDTAPKQLSELIRKRKALGLKRKTTRLEDDFPEPEDDEKKLVIGMTGYPNVGKSSTINVLLGATAAAHGVHRVAVGATPGKTKHFQTLPFTDDIDLCDCPGLVFPSFMSLKSDMVLNGVLPIDQLRDHTGPMALVCSRIPRAQLETVYTISIQKPRIGEDPDRPPHYRELLDAYCAWRGYMASTHSGYDHPRAARYILKDYISGRLLYCHTPPGYTAKSQVQAVAPPLPPKSEPKPSKGGVTMEDNVLAVVPGLSAGAGAGVGAGASVAEAEAVAVAAAAAEQDAAEAAMDAGLADLDDEFDLGAFEEEESQDKTPAVRPLAMIAGSTAHKVTEGGAKRRLKKRSKRDGRKGKGPKKGVRDPDPYGTQLHVDDLM